MKQIIFILFFSILGSLTGLIVKDLIKEQVKPEYSITVLPINIKTIEKKKIFKTLIKLVYEQQHFMQINICCV